MAATQDLAGLIQLILRVMAAPESFSELPLTMGGQERTEAEYALLLRQAGFHLIRVVPTDTAVSVIVPVGISAKVVNYEGLTVQGPQIEI